MTATSARSSSTRLLLVAALTGPLFGAAATVGVSGAAQYRTVADALAAGADDIRIEPGVYKEHLTISLAGVSLRGMGARPDDVVLTYDLSNRTAGGTTQWASITVSGDDFRAENLTMENSFTRGRALTAEGSQAVALKVMGDRAVFRRVRFLGYQDTLYANSRKCETDRGPCEPARQYFRDCYIEGNVDFILATRPLTSKTEIRALAHSTVYLTAQSKHYAEERSGYVFDHCRLTAEKGAQHIWLGRPWRAYSTVIFLDTAIDVEIEPAGWHEWEHDGKPSLPTSFYAEFRSTGRGANPERRQLTAAEAARFGKRAWLGGEDHWDPDASR